MILAKTSHASNMM